MLPIQNTYCQSNIIRFQPHDLSQKVFGVREERWI